MADVDPHVAPLGDSSAQRSVLLLLGPEPGADFDMERYVSLVLGAAEQDLPASGIVVGPVEVTCPAQGMCWRSVVVPDIARVAAAFGVLSLPAVLIAGSADETEQTIEAIVRRQHPCDSSRVSGALSSSDLR